MDKANTVYENIVDSFAVIESEDIMNAIIEFRNNNVLKHLSALVNSDEALSNLA